MRILVAALALAAFCAVIGEAGVVHSPAPARTHIKRPAIAAAAGGSAPTVVQSTHTSDAGATNPTMVFGSNLAAGNAIVCHMAGYQTDFSAPSDTQGNTYVFIASRAADGNVHFWTYAASNILGGANTVTLNNDTAPKDVSGSCTEVGGVATSPIDKFNNNAATSNDPNVSVTTLGDNRLLITGFTHAAGGNPTIAAGSGSSLIVAYTESNNNIPFGSLSKTATTAGANASDFDLGGSHAWSIVGVALKAP